MPSFLEHLVNAAGHLLEASEISQRERQFARESQRRSKSRSKRPKADVQVGAPLGESKGPDCCTGKRKLKF